MTMEEIRVIAKQRNLKTGSVSKTDLIRSIQSANGNVACFNTVAPAACQQANCMWSGDCLWHSVLVRPS